MPESLLEDCVPLTSRRISSVVALALLISAGVWFVTRPAARPGEGESVDDLRSGDLLRIAEAARQLAATGESWAIEPLEEAQTDLLDRISARRHRELWEFGDISLDEWRRRIADRRESPEWRRYWSTLDVVNRAIAELSGEPVDPLVQPGDPIDAADGDEALESSTGTGPSTGTGRSTLDSRAAGPSQ